MSTQNENLFVKLIKKSMGLPTGKSDCCGAPAGQSSDCCGSSGNNDCCGTETSDTSQSSGCGGDCCGAENEAEPVSSPAVGSSAI
ncbi:MAG: hypothetical protein Q8L87_03640 [Anaerolineales bacterium]|jgi:hypothetical protein|nr:hypothetical protein [Anaerolineales bacterium]